jgi:hypothetical protein
MLSQWMRRLLKAPRLRPLDFLTGLVRAVIVRSNTVTVDSSKPLAAEGTLPPGATSLVF